MDALGFGAGVVSAGLNYLSGQENRKAQEQANEENRAQNALNMAFQQVQSEANYQRQKEFAQQGIRWKVDDAIAAGIHPLYAMGASTTSFGPTSVGGSSLPMNPATSGNALGAMGQDISRAIHATRTPEERVVAGLNLERAGLENELLRAQIGRINQQGNPALPSGDPNSPLNVPGQSDQKVRSGGAVSTVTTADKGFEHQEKGAVADISYGLAVNGRYPIMPSEKAKNRIEDSPYEYTHFWRQVKNHMSDAAGEGTPGPYKAPPGYVWQFYPDEMSVGLVRKKKNVFPDNPFFNIQTDWHWR